MPHWLIAWLITPAAFAAVCTPVLVLAGIDLVQRRRDVSGWFAAAPVVTFLLGFVPLWSAWSNPWMPAVARWFDVLEKCWRSFWPAAFAGGLCALALAGSRALRPWSPIAWRRVAPGLVVAGLLGVFGQVSATGYHAVAVGLGAGGTGLIALLLAREPTERLQHAVGPVVGLHACGVFLIVWCGWLEDVHNRIALVYGFGVERGEYWQVALPVALLPLVLVFADVWPDERSLAFFWRIPVLALVVTLALAGGFAWVVHP